MKRVLSIVLALICLFAFSAVAVAEPAADDFLSRIQGSFVELFPEMARDEYHQAWLDVVTPLVGEENAEATVEYLLNVCMGSKYGEEAIEAYTADPDSMQFNCYFLGGVKKMTVEGNTISGVDADGSEVFRHTYSPIDVENENGFIFYQSEKSNGSRTCAGPPPGPPSSPCRMAKSSCWTTCVSALRNRPCLK